MNDLLKFPIIREGCRQPWQPPQFPLCDTVLLFGEVRGQHSIKTELMFVLLGEGTLDVPNLRLYDDFMRKWYNFVHALYIVSVSGGGDESKQLITSVVVMGVG